MPFLPFSDNVAGIMAVFFEHTASMHPVSPNTALPRSMASPPQPVARRHANRLCASGFYWRHGAVPALVAVVALGLWIALRGDLWLADRVYAWEGHRWTLRHGRITETLIHIVGHDLSVVAWLGVLMAWLAARGRPALGTLRRPLLYLLATTALASLLVAVTKHLSNVDCPWDLFRYGGDRPYVTLFEARPPGLQRGMCFPAGHASAGYIWLALYFFLLAVKPRLRWYGLATGVAAGLLFGISQQFRGAHFLSHDLATAAICWFSALAMHALFWSRPMRGPTDTVIAE